MMQTAPRNFHRVVDNLRALLAARRARGGVRGPLVNLQFLVWKGNYKTIPAMYALAREVGVDSVVFNGLAFLKPEELMTAAETAEMMALYEQVVRADGYETITAIGSFEQDLGPQVRAMNARVAASRPLAFRLRRAAHRLRREGLRPETIGRLARRALGRPGAAFDERCLIGWHSMVVRTTGGVAPCCILQGKELGNVYRQSVRDVWYGDAYQQFRRELSRILREGASWRANAERDRTVETLCGPQGSCPMISSPYGTDLTFRRSYQSTIDRLAESPEIH